MINETIAVAPTLAGLKGELIKTSIMLVGKTTIVALSLVAVRYVKVVPAKMLLTAIFVISAILTGMSVVEWFRIMMAMLAQ